MNLSDVAAQLSPSAELAWIVINSSGGKDSQTALRVVAQAVKNAGIPNSHVIVSHQDLGKMEWPGVRDLVKKQAEHYGFVVDITRYRNKTGQELTLLDYVLQRGKWPSLANRYCTSDFKRAPGGRLLTRLSSIKEGAILNVYGFRASESPARKKKQPIAFNKRFSSKVRHVWDWLPIHTWSDAEVWASIKSSGVPYHPAYDAGMPRLSCIFCIAAPEEALMLAGYLNPELLDDYCDVEIRTGHTFKHGLSLVSIRERIRNGERPKTKIHGNWNM